MSEQGSYGASRTAPAHRGIRPMDYFFSCEARPKDGPRRYLRIIEDLVASSDAEAFRLAASTVRAASHIALDACTVSLADATGRRILVSLDELLTMAPQGSAD